MKTNRLSPKVLKRIVEKTELREGSVRSGISSKAKEVPGYPLNVVAYIYAKNKGIDIRTMLTKEEQSELRNFEVMKQKTPIVIKPKTKKQNKAIITYETEDTFLKGHIEEINRAYNSPCYTAVFILTRKVIENLIIKILEKKFPSERVLYFDKDRGRYKDFSIVLDGIYKKRIFFETESSAVERLYQFAKPLKDDCNNKAHSLYHLAKKSEIEGLELQEIMALIMTLERYVGLR